MSARALAVTLALLTVLPVEISAQFASVRGYVSDAATRERLAGVNVVLSLDDGDLLGAATDADGYFVINRVPPGTAQMRVTFIGYAPLSDTLHLEQREVRMLRLELSLEESELGEIVVEAEAAEGAATTVAGLQTVRPADIERVPMPGVSGDLVSYLQTMPGVSSLGDRGGQFFIRGGTSSQNDILLDGIPLFQPFHIVGFYSAFPSEVVNKVDFYKGGFGARYGGRLSSVIDVETRNGNKDRFSGSVALAPLMSGVRVEGPIVPGRVSAIVSIRESFIEDIMSGSVGDKLPYRLGDRFGKVHAFLSDEASLSITGITTHDEGDIGANPESFLGDEISTIVADSTEIRWSNQAIGGKFLFAPVSTPIHIKATGSVFRYDTELGNDDVPEREAEVTGYKFAAEITRFRGVNRVRAGLFAERRELSYQLGDAFQNFTSNVEDLDEAGAYIESAVAVFRDLTMEPGVRLHAFPGRDRMYVEPRLRSIWFPEGRLGRHKVSAAVGIYHQGIIGLSDERDVGNVFTAWVAPPDDKSVPESIHAIAGWEGTLRPWLTVAAEGYFKSLENLSVPIFSPFPGFTTRLQEATGSIYGLDLRAEVDAIRYENWELYGYVGYGYSTVEYETDVLTYSPPHDRRHQINLVARARTGELELVAQWQFGSGFSYTKSIGFDVWIPFTGPDVDVSSQQGQTRVLFDEPYAGRLPAYHRLDVWLEKSFRRDRVKGALRAGVVNLYDRDNLFYFDLFTFRRINQLPLVPSVGIKLEID
ncbi:MAG TPA: TonB-dependent receptor [Rhodothermales bacterium]|nr:TonB-dependent receptor [Rhodothermales bacterium]